MCQGTMSIKSIPKTRRTAHHEAAQKNRLSFGIPKKPPVREEEGGNKKNSNRPFYSLYKSKSDRNISNTDCWCSPRKEEVLKITGRQITQPFGVIHSLIKKRTTNFAARKSDISKKGPSRKKSYNVPSTGYSNNNDLYQYQSRPDATSMKARRTTSEMRMVRSSSIKVKNKQLQIKQGVLQRNSSRSVPLSAEESENEDLELRTNILAIDHVLLPSTTSNDIHHHVCQSPSDEAISRYSSSKNNRPTLPATRPLHHRNFIQEELDFEETYLNHSTTTSTQKCQKNNKKSSLNHHCDLPYCKIARSHSAFLALLPSADHDTKSSSRSQFTRDSYLLHQSHKHQEKHTSHYGLTMCMPQSIRQIIRCLKGNDRCFECGTRKHLSHAFVPLGIVICDECSYDEMEFANEGDILSFEHDLDWRHHEILSVVEGGNDAFRMYLRDNCKANGEGWVIGEEALYDDVKLSVTALRYRKMLKKRVRSFATALGEEEQNIQLNTLFKDEEEECCISSIVKKKAGKSGRFSMKKISSSWF